MIFDKGVKRRERDERLWESRGSVARHGKTKDQWGTQGSWWSIEDMGWVEWRNICEQVESYILFLCFCWGCGVSAGPKASYISGGLSRCTLCLLLKYLLHSLGGGHWLFPCVASLGMGYSEHIAGQKQLKTIYLYQNSICLELASNVRVWCGEMHGVNMDLGTSPWAAPSRTGWQTTAAPCKTVPKPQGNESSDKYKIMFIGYNFCPRISEPTTLP